jgi:hypothetical protein
VSKDLQEGQNGADANVAEAGAEEQKAADLFGIGTHGSEPAKPFLESTEVVEGKAYLEERGASAELSATTIVLRRVLFGVLGTVTFILLDRSTVFLQMWPNISAWYPPVAFALAMLIGLGPKAIPMVIAGGIFREF